MIPLHAVSTEEVSDIEAEDWTTPTQRKLIPSSISMSEPVPISVPIGEISYPTRIRIECHESRDDRGNKKGDVECFIDDIRLENCQGMVLIKLTPSLFYQFYIFFKSFIFRTRLAAECL